MIAERSSLKSSKTNKKGGRVTGKPLWYVPDRRLTTHRAADRAVDVARSIARGVAATEDLTEEVLFVAMHTCAYRAGRQDCDEPTRAEWTQRWEVIRGYIVERNLGLVYSMIGRFSNRGSDEDDLLSDALLALTRATDRFNPWRGYRFSTYACNVIARALMRRGKRESNYRRLFPVQHDASFERAEGMPDTDAELYVERLRWALDQNIGALTEMESEILARRFPASRESKLTFQEIGNVVGLSKERVRQIQNVALLKLREVLVGDPILQ